MTKLFCCLVVSALALSAAELTGTWSGSFDATNSNGDTKSEMAYMNLKETGGVVTGTAGPSAEQQWPLRNGKLDGQKLKFEVLMEDGGRLVFGLVFDGDSIRGNCAGTSGDGEKMSAKLDLKRKT